MFWQFKILQLYLYKTLRYDPILARLSFDDKALIETSYGKDHFLQV